MTVREVDPILVSSAEMLEVSFLRPIGAPVKVLAKGVVGFLITTS